MLLFSYCENIKSVIFSLKNSKQAIVTLCRIARGVPDLKKTFKNQRNCNWMVLTLNMEFISLVRKDFFILSLMLCTIYFSSEGEVDGMSQSTEFF